MKLVTFFSTIYLLFIGCDYYLPDISENLGDGYLIRRSPSFPRDINLENLKNYIIVEAHIVQYKYDSIFIVCSQKNRAFFSDSMSQYRLKLNKENRLFKEYKKITYWIINKKEKSVWNSKIMKRSNVYGPFSKQEYLKKKKELGVSDSLKLDFEQYNGK